MHGTDYLPVILKINANWVGIVSGIISDLCKMNFKGQINGEYQIVNSFQILFRKFACVFKLHIK